jgi:hypothetical protein
LLHYQDLPILPGTPEYPTALLATAWYRRT